MIFRKVSVLSLAVVFMIAEGSAVSADVIMKGCDNVYHLSNEKGNYTKSVCLQRQFYDYDAAKLQCQNKGMQLLSLAQSNTLSSLFKQAGSEIESGLTFYIDSDSGDCSVLQKSGALFKILNYSCSQTMMSFCEFEWKEYTSTNPSPTPRPTPSPTPRPTQRYTPRPTQRPPQKGTQRPTPRTPQRPTLRPPQRPTPRPPQRPTPNPPRIPPQKGTQSFTPSLPQRPTPK